MSVGYFRPDSYSNLRDGVTVSEESSSDQCGDEGVRNISNHRPVAASDLKSDYIQCELVSVFHQLNINA